MDARTQAIKDTKEFIAEIEEEERRLYRRIENAAASGNFWRAKEPRRLLRQYDARLTELRKFQVFLENEYQDKADALEYRKTQSPILLCACGLVVFSKREVCFECGKPACVLHSQAHYTDGRRDGRICADCTGED